jgi:hypothetical protein
VADALDTWASAPSDSEVLDALLVAFVDLYRGMKQRDAGWYGAMGVTVGGSELPAIMGLSPYSSFYDVAASKLAILLGTDSWDGGGEACWWGVLFEDVIGAFVEVDLGGTIRGDDICIRDYPGHRNSPDGYIVARFYRGADGRPRLWTSDMPPDIPTTPRILLLEFKCPMSRKPKGDVPRHYVPQVLSGLAVSPVAHAGLFVDAVFRKCGLLDLGDTPDYDHAYHRFDQGKKPVAWSHPVAWGLIAVYAPLLDAPLRVRYGWRGDAWQEGDPPSEAPDADAGLAAWHVHSAYFGLRLKDQRACPDVADLGDMEARLFNRALGLVNRGRFPARRGPPCFADGRGAPLHTGAEVAAAIEAMRREAPEHHWLFGVLPWKLLEVDYVPVDRQPGFLEEVLPLIEAVHRAVAEAREAPDPLGFLAAKGGRPPAGEGRSTAVGLGEVQDLFDSLA